MSERARSAAAYLGAIFLCLTFLTWVLRLWKADLSVPMAYGGDALHTQLWVKGLFENGWYLTNPSVGAPFGLEMHDFPLADGLFFLLLRAVSSAARDYARALNYYFLLTFPLTTASAVFVFRGFGASRAPAVAGGLLYAFLPYHFMRGEEHLFLASYFVVPLSVAVALRVFLDGGPGAAGPGNRSALAFCLLSGSGGIYYAFFSCYLILVSGAIAALRRGRGGPLWSAVLCVGAVATGVLVNVAPNLIYRVRNGPNTEAVVRTPAHCEVFGLKLAQMILPVPDHRVPFLARLRARYDTSVAPLVNENASAALGLVGAAGFLLLTADAVRRASTVSGGVWDGLVVLNLAAVLLATFGGFGTLFGFLVNPKIRAYNRMSIFIAFFSLFAVVMSLSKADRLARARGRAWLVGLGIVALVVVGLLDQTSRSFVPRYEELRRAFASDAEFIGRVEGALPPGSMVFQLPYSPYPEPAQVHRMHWYDHVRGYLHSRSLRWSYGAMRGRYPGLWQEWVAGQSPGVMVRQLADAGFGGVYIDRLGFDDGAGGLEAELARRVGVGPMVSSDRRLSFFDIHRLASPPRADPTPAGRVAPRDDALFPVLASWGSGFYGPEAERRGPYRWCEGVGFVSLVNPAPRRRAVELTMTLASAVPAASRVRIDGPDGQTSFRVDGSGTAVCRTLVVPPGRSRLGFVGDGPPLPDRGGGRTLVFRVIGFTLSEPATAEARPGGPGGPGVVRR